MLHLSVRDDGTCIREVLGGARGRAMTSASVVCTGPL